MENTFKTLVAAGGAAVSFFFGGWSTLLGVLLAFVVMDYLSGMVAAGIEGSLCSSVGLRGIARKVFIFGMVAVAHLVDTAIADGHVFRDATIFFYLANELLSIVENSGRIGLPVPDVIKQAVGVLKGKSGGGEKNANN